MKRLLFLSLALLSVLSMKAALFEAVGRGVADVGEVAGETVVGAGEVATDAVRDTGRVVTGQEPRNLRERRLYGQGARHHADHVAHHASHAQYHANEVR